MTFWTGARVAQALGVPDPGRAFTGVSTDTRSLERGDLFVALLGDRFDAHAFLEVARDRGAAAAVVRRGTPAVPNLPLVHVPDTLTALGALGRARRRALPASAPVVAITGSSGKTTTKELTRAALAARWRVHATEGNLNNLVGVPLTLLAAPDDAQALVIEAGASVPGEISALRDVIEPTIAVVTNVGYAHVEGFGSLAAVLAEKVSLCEDAPVAVVGTDPPDLAREARRRARRVVVTGRDVTAAIRPDAARLTEDGRPELEWAGARVILPVLGLHQVDNAMIALAVATEAGVAAADALRGLAAARLPPGRGGIRQIGALTVIDDTYNANPGSLRAAIELARWLAERRRRPLVVVVGSMLELGPESDKLHAAAAREIVAAGPALVGAVGAFVPAFEALGRGLPLVTADDAEALGPPLRAALQGDEVVLLKASRGVKLERVLRHLHPAGAN